MLEIRYDPIVDDVVADDLDFPFEPDMDERWLDEELARLTEAYMLSQWKV
jgi:hypothetical protein